MGSNVNIPQGLGGEPAPIFELIVRYDNGERARYLHPTKPRALGQAASLQLLPTTTSVWINRVVVEEEYHWSK